MTSLERRRESVRPSQRGKAREWETLRVFLCLSFQLADFLQRVKIGVGRWTSRVAVK
jgi:hypothetical protein